MRRTTWADEGFGEDPTAFPQRAVIPLRVWLAAVPAAGPAGLVVYLVAGVSLPLAALCIGGLGMAGWALIAVRSRPAARALVRPRPWRCRAAEAAAAETATAETAAAAEAEAAAAAGAGESASEVAAEESAAESADDILSELRPCRDSPNLEVDTPAEMQQLFDRLSAEGTPIEGSRYPGDIVELADGTRVGLRPVSRSGGETIDLFKPDGTHIKVHLP